MSINPKVLPEGFVVGGRYHVGKILGMGGFGITYMVRDEEIQRTCAMKEYFPQEWAVRCMNGTTIEPRDVHKSYLYQHGLDVFVNEAKILYKLRDDRVVVDVFHFFRENNTAYILMEYVRGMNLAQYAKKKEHFSEKELNGIIRQVAHSLSKIHKQGLLHRDISPDNIMISESGEVKLIDFGATRQYAMNETTDMSVLIKPGFAPVEQYSRTGRQGPWTDVYALAATYYYLLTGKKPLSAVDRSAGSKMKSIRQCVPEVQENICRAIEKALEINFSHRTRSMEEFLKDLEMGDGNGEQKMPHLLVRIGGEIRKYRFGAGQSVRIGRADNECDILLRESDISRMHCQVSYDGQSEMFILKDYSLNGTFTEKGLVGKGYSVRLFPGESFYLVSRKNEIVLEVK